MASIRCLALVFGVLCATSARAEVLEIPLPTLLGTYDESVFNRHTAVELPQAPYLIHGVWLRIAGTAHVDTLACDGGVTYLLITPFEANPSEAPLAWSAAELMPMASGPFGWTGLFRGPPGYPNHFDFLLDGTTEIRLHGYAGGSVPGCVNLSPPASADVLEATLIVDAEYEAVPTLPASWGRIKAHYR